LDECAGEFIELQGRARSDVQANRNWPLLALGKAGIRELLAAQQRRCVRRHGVEMIVGTIVVCCAMLRVEARFNASSAG